MQPGKHQQTQKFLRIWNLQVVTNYPKAERCYAAVPNIRTEDQKV